MGPGNSPAIQFLAGGLVWLGSSPIYKPDRLSLGGVVTRRGYKLAIFRPCWNRPRFDFCGSINFGPKLVLEFRSYHDTISTYIVQFSLNIDRSTFTSRFQISNPTVIP